MIEQSGSSPAWKAGGRVESVNRLVNGSDSGSNPAHLCMHLQL